LLSLHGTDINKEYDNNTGWKAIHRLLLENRHLTSTMTLECMIQLTRQCFAAQTTAFHKVACIDEHFKSIVMMLVQYGANINSLDDHGNTILHVIVDSHRIPIITILEVRLLNFY
jgi:ankyrin repeat protein